MNRRRAACFIVVSLSSALVFACSSSVDESSGSSGEALKSKCPPGYVVDPNGDIGPNGKIVHGCIPADGDQGGAASPYNDDCTDPYAGQAPQLSKPAVPPALVAAGCASGQFRGWVNSQPVWECPATTPVPKSLGVVSTTQGACFRPDGTQLFDGFPGTTCEASWSGPSLRTNCLGGSATNGWTATPAANNELVADIVLDVYTQIPPIDGGGGPCTGGCAAPRPPFAQ